MRLVILFCAAACLLTSIYAEAEVIYGPRNNNAYADSRVYADTAFNVDVSPTRGCEPMINFVEINVEGPAGKGTINFSVAVDNKEQWNITKALLEVRDVGDGYAEIITSKTSPEFINQLRRGRTLYVQWEMADGSLRYDSFSLMGFSRAFGKAKAACIAPSQRFNARPSVSREGELFL